MTAENNLRKGPWYEEEDEKLKTFVAVMGERRWDSLASASGLKRSGKSCRLRWLNYLRPCLKRSPITLDEERIILQLHEKWGNKWASIARRLPGRTDNEIKNYWRSYIRKRLQSSNYNNPLYNSFSNDRPSSEETLSYMSDNQSNNSSPFQDASSNTKQSIVSVELQDKIDKDEYANNVQMHYETCINNHSEVSDYTITSSPYEDRISDWISTLSRQQSDISSDLSCWESNSLESFDYSCMWSVGQSSSACLWDVDLFNV